MFISGVVLRCAGTAN